MNFIFILAHNALMIDHTLNKLLALEFVSRGWLERHSFGMWTLKAEDELLC